MHHFFSATVEEQAAAPPVGPKHSQSIGELASILPADNHPRQHRTTPDQEQAENPEKAKHFWKRKQDLTKPAEKSSVHKDVKSKAVKERHTPPVILKESAGVKRHRSASPAVEGSPSASPKKRHKKIPEAQQPKPEAHEKKLGAHEKKLGAHKKQEVHKQAEVKKRSEAQKKPDSPKWFHFPSKQQRSRSESPDRQKKGGQPEAKGEEHPLGVTASHAERAGDTPSAEEPQTNVLDRIKHYNIKDASVQGEAVGGRAGKGTGDIRAGESESAEGGKVGERSVEKDRGKEKGKTDAKVKDKASDKNKKTAKKEAGSAKKEDVSSKKSGTPTKHWNPFKKSQKNVDKKKDSEKKTKKAKEAEVTGKDRPAVHESAQMFAGVKNRIEKLKELGLETDGTDDGEAVLLSVVQKSDGAPEEVEDLDGEGEDEEEDGETGDEVSEEWDTSEGEEEVDFGASSPDEVSVNDNVMEKVKKLQEMHSSRSMEIRPRCFTEDKRYELYRLIVSCPITFVCQQV